MSKFIKVEGLGSINTSESTYGDFLIQGRKLIIPFYNANVISDDNMHLKKEKGNYIKFCYLVFEEVSGIVWDYDMSRTIGAENRECYGGIYYRDNNYYEFWIKFSRGFIYLEQDYQSSSVPWENIEGNGHDFFKGKEIG